MFYAATLISVCRGFTIIPYEDWLTDGIMKLPTKPRVNNLVLLFISVSVFFAVHVLLFTILHLLRRTDLGLLDCSSVGDKIQ